LIKILKLNAYNKKQVGHEKLIQDSHGFFIGLLKHSKYYIVIKNMN